ncbi:DUF1080 domain-containing protein [uncultured Algibacter sp.]|uniref:3-keto-disaccharide hydrolase n=1 Tax=uncultured Algibacter sp. TaxID=298659 RepID=UPI00260BE591|nr:DUF1080 domain-containing protein [uncultured Algibacter sp.]
MHKSVCFLILVFCFYVADAQENKIQKAIELGVYDGIKEPTKHEETEFYTPVPPVVNPVGQNGVPSDAIVLFDGTNLDAWENNDGSKPTWKINSEDKSTTIDRGPENKRANIKTKQKFGSVQLHVEWKAPEKIKGKGQSRGNSGVFLQERYEVQILDNNNNDVYVNGQVGSIYKQSIPLANASVPTGEWNTYDIIFHAPIYKGKKKIKAGTITVLHNGVLVQDHFIIKGATSYIGWPKDKPHGKASIKLQDHNSPVSFRNIWVRELD